ncbi:NADPH oxidase 2-like isoform X2 [Apostichopus japonicus]|uniref:NADPH oxidase 2-like isoform X2 n=1 Tax=Stichopus japonicus TaxID=307972 RepID=UPI003AB7AB81
MNTWKLVQRSPTITFTLIWLGWNIYQVVKTIITYETAPRYHYIRQLTGPGVSVAKAGGAVLNLNSMLILLPICRNLISFFRGSCNTNQFCRRSVRRQLDKNITFHKCVAYMIATWTVIHVVAHMFNFRNLYYNRTDCENDYYGDRTDLSCKLSNIANLSEDTNNWINPILRENTKLPFGLDLILQGLTPIAGWSGAILTVVFIVMFSSATEFIRRSYFETFWVTHHLFTIYFAMLLVHGTGGIIRSQTADSLNVHDPEICQDSPQTWNMSGVEDACPYPKFVDGKPASWKWCIGPIALYIIERSIRFVRSFLKVTVSKVIKHPSNVIEVQMKKAGFKMQPGQYIFLKCPSISHVQWHPFTLTSAPEQDHFSVHIRLVGDWTKSLSKTMGADSDAAIDPANLPRVAVDGPFGTASVDIFKYQVAMCVGAGIGITPFASILRSIWLKSVNHLDNFKLRKVYFFWICPDTNAFEWFTELLESIENHFVEQGKADFLKYNIYLTRGWTNKQAKHLYLQEEQEIDAITGLRQKTNYGKPMWDSIFKHIAEENKGVSVGTFFCGPKALSAVLHENCNKHSKVLGEGARFFYNKENF